VNLLITGKATSNVFDGIKTMDGTEFELKGVDKQTDVGYLTHLEALRFLKKKVDFQTEIYHSISHLVFRYCRVGNYMKSPLFPIWVVGSQSHYTVLFSLDTNVNSQSNADLIFERCQRAFLGNDVNEMGFIQPDQIKF